MVVGCVRTSETHYADGSISARFNRAVHLHRETIGERGVTYMTKIVNAWNEWVTLKRLILGRPEGTVSIRRRPQVNRSAPHRSWRLV